MRKTMVYGLAFALVAMMFLAVPMSVGGEYAGTITILSDGTVVPSDAPIHVKGMKYTLADDIAGNIVIEMSGITLDGAGHTIEGTGLGNGIFAMGLSGVTIKDTVVKNFDLGIVMVFCDSSTVKENEVSDCFNGGIHLYGSNDNTLKDNAIWDNYWEGIWLDGSSDNLIKDNRVWNNGEAGIFLWYSCNNNLLKDNKVYENGGLFGPNSGGGILLFYDCNRNVIKDNDASDKNGVGIVISDGSSDNVVTGNTIRKNMAGGIYIRFDCHNNEITKNTVFKCYFSGQCGLRILFSGGNMVSQNSVAQCYRGLLVVNNPLDNPNSITENTFCDNYRGLHFIGGGNNVIYHCNVIRNEIQVEDNSAGNQYDDSSGGNYWSDYKGKDADKDGIGDAPYMIFGSAGEQDDYPLMKPYNW